MGRRVEPGLYRICSPTAESQVFASANYTLNYDALRSALAGVDAYILVLDTKGINVWCAAREGTFGTDEQVKRVEKAGFDNNITPCKIIVPQLGAPGISAHDVQRRSCFRVEYGPVRARDLPEYLRRGKTTPRMRKEEFPVRDRIVLIPVEFVHIALNFTGATTFISHTGVRKEIFRYVPVIAVMAGAVVVLGIVLGVNRLLGVI